MSYRITDLLDDYMDSSVHLFPPEEVLASSPAYPDGAPNTPTPPQSRHRMKKPLVIAAALLLVLTGAFTLGFRLWNGNGGGASLAEGSQSPPSVALWGTDASQQEDAASSREKEASAEENSRVQYARSYRFDIVPDSATLIAFLDLPAALPDGEATLLAVTYDAATGCYSWVFRCDPLDTLADAASQDAAEYYLSQIVPVLKQQYGETYFIDFDGEPISLELGGALHALDGNVFCDMLTPSDALSGKLPAYVEVNGSAYAFSLSGASNYSTSLLGNLQSFSDFNQNTPAGGQNELWLDPDSGQYTWVLENSTLHAALLAASPSGSYEEACEDSAFQQDMQSFEASAEMLFHGSCELVYSDGTALPLTGNFSWRYEAGLFYGSGSLTQCAEAAGIEPEDTAPAYLLVEGTIVPLVSNTQGDQQRPETDTSANDPTLSPGEDTDGDGLLTAQLDIPIETAYGTAMLQKFTLELSSSQFRWYVDCSQLSDPFTEDYVSMNDALKRSEFESASLAVLNTVQEAISDNHLVYPDGSQLFVPTGELVDYYDHIHECYDTLGVATEQPTCDQNPSCLEIGGVTYGFD